MTDVVLYQHPSDNVAPLCATIGVNTGAEDADYPAEYLVDERPGRPAKLSSTSGSWVLDFGAAQCVDLVALGAHNLSSATIQANGTNDWTSPALSVALTIPNATEDGHSVNAWIDLTGENDYDPYGFRYWRLVVAGSVACAVGELWLGATRRKTLRGYALGFDNEESHPAIVHQTELGVPLVYSFQTRERRLRLTFRATETGAAQLLGWYRAMNGVGRVGLFIPDASVNDARWVRQLNDYSEKVLYPGVRDISMQLVEYATGLPL